MATTDFELTEKEWLRIVAQSEWDGDCLLWKGCQQQRGYGVICFRNHCTTVHRIMLQSKLGRALGEGMESAHSCRNRNCINPDHLTEKSPRDNQADRIADGTWGMKMTPEKVISIRASKESLAALAQQHGISFNTAWKIKSGQTWRHVQSGTPDSS